MASVKDYILEIFKKNEIPIQRNLFPIVEKEKFEKSSYFKFIKEAYSELGGIENEIPYQSNEYDFQLKEGIILIDTEKDYNRYRAITLRSEIYKLIPSINTENHKRFCRQYETECLKSAGNINNWSNKESEKYYGRSQEIGDLSEPGPSLWKLNAMKNFMTDISSLVLKTKIFRISPYDNLVIGGKMIKVKDLLLQRSSYNELYLLNYMLRGLGIPVIKNKEEKGSNPGIIGV